MDTSIARHPFVFFGTAIALACLLAAAYVALADYVVPDLSWLAGVPDPMVVRSSVPSLDYLQTCYFSNKAVSN